MGSKIKTSRVVAFGLIVALLIALCVGTLYQLQIINGAAYYDESINSITSYPAVLAARGNILTATGALLVGNRECYNLVINTVTLFDEDQTAAEWNAIILEMVNIVEDSGATCTDDLPITTSPPFEYTDMNAFQRTLLNAYFTRHGLDEDTTAVELMSYFRTRYDIDNTYSAEDMRKISAIRYALNVRYAINTSSYTFVEDASHRPHQRDNGRRRQHNRGGEQLCARVQHAVCRPPARLRRRYERRGDGEVHGR